MASHCPGSKNQRMALNMDQSNQTLASLSCFILHCLTPTSSLLTLCAPATLNFLQFLQN